MHQYDLWDIDVIIIGCRKRAHYTAKGRETLQQIARVVAEVVAQDTGSA